MFARASTSRPIWQSLQDEGRQHFAKKEFREALESYQTALISDPPRKDQAVLKCQMIACLLQLHDTKEALRQAQACTKSHPDHSQAFVRLAEVYLQMHENETGRSNDACNALQNALKLDPDNSYARQLLVHQLQGRDQPRNPSAPMPPMSASAPSAPTSAASAPMEPEIDVYLAKDDGLSYMGKSDARKTAGYATAPYNPDYVDEKEVIKETPVQSVYPVQTGMRVEDTSNKYAASSPARPVSPIPPPRSATNTNNYKASPQKSSTTTTSSDNKSKLPAQTNAWSPSLDNATAPLRNNKWLTLAGLAIGVTTLTSLMSGLPETGAPAVPQYQAQTYGNEHHHQTLGDFYKKTTVDQPRYQSVQEASRQKEAAPKGEASAPPSYFDDNYYTILQQDLSRQQYEHQQELQRQELHRKQQEEDRRRRQQEQERKQQEQEARKRRQQEEQERKRQLDEQKRKAQQMDQQQKQQAYQQQSHHQHSFWHTDSQQQGSQDETDDLMSLLMSLPSLLSFLLLAFLTHFFGLTPGNGETVHIHHQQVPQQQRVNTQQRVHVQQGVNAQQRVQQQEPNWMAWLLGEAMQEQAANTSNSRQTAGNNNNNAPRPAPRVQVDYQRRNPNFGPNGGWW
jgi:tetratricopeptide (TPR) repeat protein